LRPPLALDLYLVTDRDLCGTRGVEAVVAEAVAGGATMVQLRDDVTPDAALVARARRLVTLLKSTGVPLIVNNRVEIAIAAGAAGVHVGQSDTPAALVRSRLGPAAIVGLSITAAEQLAAVPAGIVDYLGVGPVFTTATKPDAAPAMGLAGLAEIRALTELPIVAIGGLSEANAGSAIAAGADGVAVVSAICSAGSPRLAAQELLGLVRAARQGGTGL
jgi:thiamine-phosphate pyrophosphorylase